MGVTAARRIRNWGGLIGFEIARNCPVPRVPRTASVPRRLTVHPRPKGRHPEMRSARMQSMPTAAAARRSVIHTQRHRHRSSSHRTRIASPPPADPHSAPHLLHPRLDAFSASAGEDASMYIHTAMD